MPPGLTEGSIPSPRSVKGPERPRSFGIEGPVMSASSIPTCRPLRASSIASSAVTEDFPTPPLPLPTATTWRMPPLSMRWRSPRAGGRAGAGGGDDRVAGGGSCVPSAVTARTTGLWLYNGPPVRGAFSGSEA